MSNHIKKQLDDLLAKINAQTVKSATNTPTNATQATASTSQTGVKPQTTTTVTTPQVQSTNPVKTMVNPPAPVSGPKINEDENDESSTVNIPSQVSNPAQTGNTSSAGQPIVQNPDPLAINIPQGVSFQPSSPQSSSSQSVPATSAAQQISNQTTTEEMPEGVLDSSRVAYWSSTQDNIYKLEEMFGMPILMIVVKNGSMFTSEDVGEIDKILAKKGKMEKLGIVISGGGIWVDEIIHLELILRRYANHITVICPRQMTSNFGLISLIGDEVVFTTNATLWAFQTWTNTEHPYAPLDRNHEAATIESRQMIAFLKAAQNEKFMQGDDYTKTPMYHYAEKTNPTLLGQILSYQNNMEYVIKKTLEPKIDDPDTLQSLTDLLMGVSLPPGIMITPKELKEHGMNIRVLSGQEALKVSLLVEDFLNLLNQTTDVDNDKKVVTWRDAVYEMEGIRSWYYVKNIFEKDSAGKWVRSDRLNYFRRAGKIKSKHGYDIISPIDSYKDYLRWLMGEEISEED